MPPFWGSLWISSCLITLGSKLGHSWGQLSNGVGRTCCLGLTLYEPGLRGLCRLLSGWRDISLALWGLQSLVLVSRLPFVRLFQALLSLIAPEYFDKLAPCLEAGKWLSGAARAVSFPSCSAWWLWQAASAWGRLLTLASCVYSVQ